MSVSDGSTVEQAKGVVILRYGVTPAAAERLLRIWGQTAGVSTEAVAHTLVHHICVDLACPDLACPDLTWLERWLEGRLRSHPPEELLADDELADDELADDELADDELAEGELV